MFRKEWHVVLTYLTFRWFWFVAAVTALFTYRGFRMVLSDVARQEDGISFVFVLAMPVFLFNNFVLHVAKWQCANPRARLIPGYLGPHLGVLAVVLGVSQVALPVSVAALAGVPCWGLLALFTLVLGAGQVWTTGSNRVGLSGLVLIAVFFSAYSEKGADFWFLDQHRYLPLQVALAAAGLAGVVGWLWRLTQLTEEMADYMVPPLGGWQRPSRLEASEQRKFEGRAAGRKGIVSWISDRWHDRLPRPAKTPAERRALLRYGYSNIPLAGQALVAGCGLVAFTLLTFQIHQYGNRAPQDYSIRTPMFFTQAIPLFFVALQLGRRQGRMAGEFLFPLARSEYIDGLLWSSAKVLATIWVALLLALGAVTIWLQIPIDHNLLIAYPVFSLALQVPSFGIALRLAQVRNFVLLMFSFYGVAILQGVLTYWWYHAVETYGDLVVTLMFAVPLVVVGGILVSLERQGWLRVELG